jgi:hypothetical protein
MEESNELKNTTDSKILDVSKSAAKDSGIKIDAPETTNEQSEQIKLKEQSAYSNNQNAIIDGSFTSFRPKEGELKNNLASSKNIPDNSKVPSLNVKDQEIIDSLNTGRKITDDEIKRAPVLLMEEFSGNLLRRSKLTINASGLTKGLRNAKDGVAFFGKVNLIF